MTHRSEQSYRQADSHWSALIAAAAVAAAPVAGRWTRTEWLWLNKQRSERLQWNAVRNWHTAIWDTNFKSGRIQSAHHRWFEPQSFSKSLWLTEQHCHCSAATAQVDTADTFNGRSAHFSFFALLMMHLKGGEKTRKKKREHRPNINNIRGTDWLLVCVCVLCVMSVCLCVCPCHTHCSNCNRFFIVSFFCLGCYCRRRRYCLYRYCSGHLQICQKWVIN